MYEINYISNKKKRQLVEYQKQPIVKGDNIYVKHGILFPQHSQFPDKLVLCVVNYVVGNVLNITESYSGREIHTIDVKDVDSRFDNHVGANPFLDDNRYIRSINYSMESIINGLDLDGEKRKFRKPYSIQGVQIKELNWNPYVYDENNNKLYYQRDFVWTKKDNQLLIESIYNGIECGRILIKTHDWSTIEKRVAMGETDVAFKDIVDGKQRLNAIRGFLMGEYKDLHGNYFGDLSQQAQNKFGDHQLFSYAEMGDGITDKQVIQQFLKVNFTGRPQSTEHINYVKEIMKKI